VLEGDRRQETGDRRNPEGLASFVEIEINAA